MHVLKEWKQIAYVLNFRQNILLKVIIITIDLIKVQISPLCLLVIEVLNKKPWLRLGFFNLGFYNL